MKYKYSIYILMVFTFTLVALVALPVLVKKATYTPPRYPFMYYSSLMKELCLMDYSNKEFPMQDKRGNIYTTTQTDSLLPLLNYRQLRNDGLLPDSIDGKEITVPILRTTSINFRHNPSDINRPETGLHILYEAMPKRVSTILETPPDVFRASGTIEFINIESNEVDHKKSAAYMAALEKAGFVFPIQWVSGNPQPRKAYEEGYFCLDASGELFHMKMVNNRPFVRNTHLGKQLAIRWFAMYESPNKRFYGFLFDQQGDTYIVEDGGGKYDLVKLDIAPIDIEKDRMVIMGNLLYWTVTITGPEGMTAYGLDTETLSRQDEYYVAQEYGLWDNLSKWVFPWYISLENSDTKYNVPVFHFTGWNGFIIGFLLAAIYMGIAGRKKRYGFVYGLYIALTGVAGCIVFWLLPNMDE